MINISGYIKIVVNTPRKIQNKIKMIFIKKLCFLLLIQILCVFMCYVYIRNLHKCKKNFNVDYYPELQNNPIGLLLKYVHLPYAFEYGSKYLFLIIIY